MQETSKPIDRQSLLAEANRLIREHEDTLAGIEATDVTQRNGVLISAANSIWMNKACRRRKAPRYSTCLNTWRTRCRRSIT